MRHWITPRDLYPTFEANGFDTVLGVHETFLARQITLLLSPLDDPRERIPISVYFPRVRSETWRFADDPVCVLMPTKLPRQEAAVRLLRTVATAQLEGERPCLLRATELDGR